MVSGAAQHSVASDTVSDQHGAKKILLPTRSTCADGQWSCTKKGCVGKCAVLGGSRFSTYDGKTYSYHGDCTYVLSKVRPLSARALRGTDGKLEAKTLP